jgi:Ca-activated chloride channel family protein
VVTYSGGTSVLLSGVPATEQATIEAAIENLYSKGKTRGKKGLKKAYKLAQQHFIPHGNNRIILATDGVFQLGELFPLAESMAGNDIALSVFSFGVNESRKQYQLDELARLGEGRHTAILPDNVEERLLEEVRGGGRGMGE